MKELANHFNSCRNLFTNGLIKEIVSVLENICGNFGQKITTDVTQQLGVKECLL